MFMRGRTAKIEWRREDDAVALKLQYVSERDLQIKPRLHLLWLVRHGERVQAAAALVGVHVRTARQWVAWYREGGLETVRSKKRRGPGSVCRLSAEQQEALWQEAATNGFSSALAAALWVKGKFGVEYAAGSMGNLLARKGIFKKVPRPMNVRASDEAQEAYKKGD